MHRLAPVPSRVLTRLCSSKPAKADGEQTSVPTLVDKDEVPPKPMEYAHQRRLQLEEKFTTTGPKSIFTYRPVQATNLSYPNPKGVEFHEAAIRVGDLPKEAKRFLSFQKKQGKKEISSYLDPERIELANDLFGPRHNQLLKEWEFRNDEDMARWQTGCDSDWAEGFSTVQLERSDSGTALFHGNLSTKILRDGKIDKAGWATMKSVDLKTFNRKNYHKHWTAYNEVILKCRGDGRSYKLMLYTPGYIDVTWGNSYSYPLHTHGGPYWQYVRIPFSRFFQTVGGRIMDVQQPLPPNLVRMDGPFRLEVAWIGVSRDQTHRETLAYETYNLPLLNVNSI